MQIWGTNYFLSKLFNKFKIVENVEKIPLEGKYYGSHNFHPSSAGPALKEITELSVVKKREASS